jgi:hypothetical protein
MFPASRSQYLAATIVKVNGYIFLLPVTYSDPENKGFGVSSACAPGLACGLQQDDEKLCLEPPE